MGGQTMRGGPDIIEQEDPGLKRVCEGCGPPDMQSSTPVLKSDEHERHYVESTPNDKQFYKHRHRFCHVA